MTEDEAEVIRIERMRLHSLVTRDMKIADSLHAPDYQLITPSGSILSKVQYLDRVASKDLEYVVFEPASGIAAMSSKNLVALRYRARIVLCVAVDDQSQFHAWHTDVYEQRDGRWLAVWSQATEIS